MTIKRFSSFSFLNSITFSTGLFIFSIPFCQAPGANTWHLTPSHLSYFIIPAMAVANESPSRTKNLPLPR